MARRPEPRRGRGRAKPPHRAARPPAKKKARPAADPPTDPPVRPSPPQAGALAEEATESRAEVGRLAAALADERDLVRGLERLLTAARHVTGAEAGTVYLRRGELLEFAAVQNDVLAGQIGEEEVRRRVGARPLSLRETSIASYVVLTRATVNLRDAYEIPVDRPFTLLREVDRKADYRTRSMLALPLRDGRGRVFGVLQLINAVDRGGAVRPFTAEDQQVVQAMATLAALLPTPTAD